MRITTKIGHFKSKLRKNILARKTTSKKPEALSDTQKKQQSETFGFRLPKVVFSKSKKENNIGGVVVFWKKALQNPAFNYQFLWILIICLSLIGLVMQFSSVTIRELNRGVNPYWGISKPLLYFFVGYAFLFVARLFPPRFYLRFALGIYIFALGFQSLVLTGLGKEINGNRNWIIIPGTGTAVQPSEFLKVAFIVLLASIIARGYCDFKSFKSLAVWMGVPYIVCVFFVYLGNDMGTIIIFTTIVVTICFICGIKKRFLVYIFIALISMAVPMVVSSSSRIKRIKSSFFWGNEDPLETGFQMIRSRYGLGTGGLTGIGPGASREKWLYLPEAQTDFIYAIIGEEMGFLGTTTVICLFICLAWVLLRLVLQSYSLGLRICAGGAVGWIVMQAIINILVVIGVSPVVGLPLPLISSGGSSQAASMTLFGIIFSYMRFEPGIRQYLTNRRKKQTKTSSIQARVK